MLKSITKNACGLAVALSFVGTSAFAETHIVEITGGAFMPSVTYLNSGDDLLFVNEGGNSFTITGGGNRWTSGALQPGSTYVQRVENGIPFTFSAVTLGGRAIAGSFSFAPAPLGDGSGY